MPISRFYWKCMQTFRKKKNKKKIPDEFPSRMPRIDIGRGGEREPFPLLVHSESKNCSANRILWLFVRNSSKSPHLRRTMMPWWKPHKSNIDWLNHRLCALYLVIGWRVVVMNASTSSDRAHIRRHSTAAHRALISIFSLEFFSLNKLLMGWDQAECGEWKKERKSKRTATSMTWITTLRKWWFF